MSGVEHTNSFPGLAPTVRVSIIVDAPNINTSANVAEAFSGRWVDYPKMLVELRRWMEDYLPGHAILIKQMFYINFDPENVSSDPDSWAAVNAYRRALEFLGSMPEIQVIVYPKDFRGQSFIAAARDPEKKHLIQEKMVDVGIAAELMDIDYHHSADWVIVVTGDGDIIPAIRKVRSHGRTKVLLASIYDFTHRLYREGGELDGRIIWLDEMADQISNPKKIKEKSDPQ